MPDFDEALRKVNQRLKAGAVRVSIARRNQKLYLVATLPKRPDSKSAKEGSFQQDVAIGVSANIEGLKAAEFRAKELDAQLSLGKFDWNEWLNPSLKARSPQTVGDWLERFEEFYFESRQRSPNRLNTFNKDYRQRILRMPQDALLSTELMRSTILTTQPDSRNRRGFCISYQAFARFAGIDCDFRSLQGSYSPSSVDPNRFHPMRKSWNVGTEFRTPLEGGCMG